MTTQRHYVCFKFSSKTLKSAFEVKILRKYVILEEKMTEITCFEFLPIRETQKQTRANKNQAPGELD